MATETLTHQHIDPIEDPAATLTPLTPSTTVYDLIAAGMKRDVLMDDLLSAIAHATGMAARDLMRHAAYIGRHFTLSRSGETEMLALDVLEKHFGYGLLLKVGDDRALYAFQGTHWAELPDHRLRQLMTPICLQRPMVYGGPGTVTGAINLIKDLAPAAEDFLLATPMPVINTLSCEVWIGGGGQAEMRIHRPETGMRFVLPVAYDPTATSPIFDKALAEIFSKAEEPDELTRHVFELMGYAIQPVRDIPVIGFLWGGGANGKSLLLGILKAIAGRHQVFAGTLGSMMRDRFMLPNLAGKLMFVEDDAKDGVELDDGLLKMVAENKIIDSRRVRATHSMSFLSMVMPFIAINGAPKLADTSDGMRRRLHVIPFQRQFTKEEIDPGLGGKIVQTELSGVLNHLVAGISRLRARGHFDPSKDAEIAKEAFLAASNSLLDFIQDRCIQVAGERVGLKDFHSAYVTWMKQTGQPPEVTHRTLKPKLVAMGFQVRKSGAMVIENLALKDG